MAEIFMKFDPDIKGEATRSATLARPYKAAAASISQGTPIEG